MDLALESYDVCTGLLQSKPKQEGKHHSVSLPNLRLDALISVEEVANANKDSLFTAKESVRRGAPLSWLPPPRLY